MTSDDIEKYLFIFSRIEALHDELGFLSKKNPNDGLNKFKLSAINSLLLEANSLLDELRPIHDFYQFEEDDVPTTSDALMVMALYRKAMEKLRSSNIVSDYNGKEWSWMSSDGKTHIKTRPPSVL